MLKFHYLCIIPVQHSTSQSKVIKWRNPKHRNPAVMMMTHSHFPAPHEASQFIVKFMRHNINIDRHHHPIQYQTKYLHKRNAAEQRKSRWINLRLLVNCTKKKKKNEVEYMRSWFKVLDWFEDLVDFVFGLLFMLNF